MLLKARKSKVKVSADPAPGERPLPVWQKEAFWPHGPVAEGEGNPMSLPPFISALIPS